MNANPAQLPQVLEATEVAQFVRVNRTTGSGAEARQILVDQAGELRVEWLKWPELADQAK